MTRKDYILIAAALKEARDMLIYSTRIRSQGDALNGIDACVYEMSDALGRDNPRFDRARFLKAAGVQS